VIEVIDQGTVEIPDHGVEFVVHRHGDDPLFDIQMVAQTSRQRTPTMPEAVTKLTVLNVDEQDMEMQTFFESVGLNRLID
jgi:hypothetical protein